MVILGVALSWEFLYKKNKTQTRVKIRFQNLHSLVCWFSDLSFADYYGSFILMDFLWTSEMVFEMLLEFLVFLRIG